ncbi:MAG: 1-(5-phosphoribosyl)-5-[(5-phosphoribosylamino)methylideneamino]imidazole-4-carboxamide isomerase [Tenericutes bacterium GWC2_34_14]|nr:MAG: 1-(5-phosphoribosyl)-5-[(5-phosphoribosylamino)methylideneamino]imidazole-4-carboxamide isomerase [Tenericutes bacterium GWC2_34_14]OHE34925.1 MAG: 1-(5-phosphoribosyl)-5-[(5-phosphoribosylamino)methylideneamino]imidazole-4-carboxamide isomerase [Tenericutes bacterium GWE2_34_108]OHE37215.1 MAG: 1-(5-phosphoribosyl)-5-[(5-phosphoribosylamino)methylideneamino]imidazole-4-carboxamide isomerase [Tenericutes bacterium GWF1_35_14]OHE39653.1 MAG: 1-(5-phosphoribosyl)-5-[(5-phosphoribosylamino)
MIIYPAIDLKNKCVVRLIQGDFKQETIYSKQPVKIAKSFELEGASHLHIVDLNGAEEGDMIHECTIDEIISKTNLSVQVGGGVRTLERVKQLLELGVTDVIVGSIAIEDPALLETMVKTYPNRIIVSIDAKDGYVLTKGWQEKTQQKALTFIKTMENIGIKKIVYTDVSKDGMLSGPSFEQLALLLKITSMKIIASGGITSLEDLIKLNRMGLYGAIVGKALYEKRFTLKEAILCLQNELYRA